MSEPRVGRWKVTFDGRQIEVSATLTDEDEADALIRAVQANKALLIDEEKRQSPVDNLR